MKICVLLCYANPHVTGWLDEFIDISNEEVIVGVINSVKKYRRNYFDDADEKENYLYFFKGKKYKKNFYDHVKQCDCLITLGIYEAEFLKTIISLRTAKRIFVLSESFNPYSKPRSVLRNLYSVAIRVFKRSTAFYFLCIGGREVKNYYSSIGFRKSHFFQFGFFSRLDLCKKEFIKGGPLKFIYVGQLIERKGIDILISVLGYLKSKYDNWEFLIVGNGVLKDELLRHCDADKRIRYFANVQDRLLMKQFFNQSHILLLPSYFDGWGAVVNEALSSCCSLILSKKVFAGKSLLKNEENGFDFDPSRIGDLYCILDKYFNEPDILNVHFKNSEKIFVEWNHRNAAISLANLLTGRKNPQNETLLKKI